MKIIYLLSLSILVVFISQFKVSAQTVLTPGDVAIIAFNSTNPDEFAFVTLRDLTAGTVINFTDNGFSSPTSGRTGENFLTYTAPSNICAGTVISWMNGMSIVGTGWSASAPTNFAFNAQGDQLFAFQGPTANWSSQSGITLLYGITTVSNWLTTGTAAAPTSYSPSGLSDTYKLVILTNNNLALTSLSLTGTAVQIISQVNNPTNYTQALDPVRVSFPTYSQFVVNSANFSYPQSPFCSNDNSEELPVFEGISGGVFSGSNSLLVNQLSGGFTPNNNSSGSYQVTYSYNYGIGCSDLTSTTSVNITQLPTATISYSGSPFCSNASQQAPVLVGDNSGSYSSTNGLSIQPNGLIAPSSSIPGSYLVTYSIPAFGGCGQVNTTSSLTITAIPNPGFSYSNNSLCTSGPAVQPSLSGTSPGVFSTSQGLTLDASSGEINPTSSAPGTYSVQFTIPAANGCSDQSSLQSISIEAQPNATVSYPNSPYCSNSGFVLPVLTGTTGGVFSSAVGVSLNNTTGIINTSASVAGAYTVNYVIPASQACPIFSTFANISITELPTASISYSEPFCSTSPVQNVSLLGTVGGSFSANNGLAINSGNGDIDPSNSLAGVSTVSYTIPASNGCPSQTFTTTVNINDLNPPSISYSASSFCNDGTFETVSQTGSSGGTYTSTTGLSINGNSGQINLASSLAGTYTITYSVPASGGCPIQTATASVSIVAAPVASISYANSPFCQGGANEPVNLVGSSGGTYSSSSGLSVDANSGTIDLSASQAGTYTVTYTIPAANGCSAFSTTASATINAPPSANLNYAGTPFCSTAGLQSVTQIGTSGGSYSSTLGLTINASTGEINPATSSAGSYTVTYTVASSGGCSASSATTNVAVIPAPTATISYATPFCTSSSSAQNPTLTGSSGGTYSSTSGLTISASTGAISPITSTAGTYTVTYSVPASAGCASFSTTTQVSLSSPATASISYLSSPFCTNSSPVQVTLSGSQGGIFSSTSGLTLNSTTGQIQPGLSQAGTYTILYTLAAIAGCPSQTFNTSVIISELPAATLSYSGPPFCTNSPQSSPSLQGTPGGSFSANSGLSINTGTGVITPNLSSAGNYTVTYTMPGNAGCPSQNSTTNVSVNTPVLTLISYGNGIICSNTSSVTPTISGLQGGTFSASNGLQINAVTGEISPVLSVNGTYVINYQTPTGANGGCSATNASQVINIQVPILPVISSTGSSNICGTGQNVELVSNYSTGNSWSVGGSNDTLVVYQAGSIVLTVTDANGCSGVSAPFTVNTASALDNSVTVVGNIITSNQNNASYQWYYCTPNLTEIPGEVQQGFSANQNGDYAVEITVNGCIATSACTTILIVGQKDLETETWKVYPNPGWGRVRIGVPNFSNQYKLNVFSTLGVNLLSDLQVEENQEIDLDHLPDGIYYLKLSGYSDSILKWIKTSLD